MKIVSAAEMREIDRITTERFGVPSLVLMENAGTAVAEFVQAEYAAAQRVGVICGRGNNGGDGLVVVRKLREAGREVLLLLLADPAELRGDAAAMFEKLPVKPFIVRSESDLTGEQVRAVLRADVLIDAVLGTGFRPPVQELYAAAIRAMNASSAPIVAVDIPSGANSDATHSDDQLRARAGAVVTFTAPKPAHVFADITPGPVLIAPIGSPGEAVVSSLGLNVITAHDLSSLIGARPRDSNKGNFGHVLVVGGALGKAGAAAMAGMSALRAGAGLSTVATARSVLPTVASFHPELMTEPLDETERGTISLRALEYGRFDHLMRGKTVLAIGPGISQNAETAEFARTMVSKYQLPTVIDADGLNAFEGHVRQLNGRDRALVITPHPGEMARLTGLSTADVQKDRLKVARTFARDHELIVVLKGHRTLIAYPDGTVWVNTTGNPGMATGGTGDILTGMVAGLIAQHPKHIFEAVLGAVYLHGLAGDVARDSIGEPFLVATDLVKALPEAFRRTQNQAKIKVVRIG
jgi:ADP-dependent NAD(P)H-hydrate dehydratase / NAD(P)H-hydrate epimerase